MPESGCTARDRWCLVWKGCLWLMTMDLEVLPVIRFAWIGSSGWLVVPGLGSAVFVRWRLDWEVLPVIDGACIMRNLLCFMVAGLGGAAYARWCLGLKVLPVIGCLIGGFRLWLVVPTLEGATRDWWYLDWKALPVIGGALMWWLCLQLDCCL